MKPISKVFWNVFDRLNNFLAVIAGVLIIFMMLSVTYSVILRYVFDSRIYGIFEIWEYSILFLPFLGAAWLMKKEGHVILDVLLIRFRPKIQTWMLIVNSLISAAGCWALAWYGTRLTWESFQTGYLNTHGELYPPEYLILMIIPFGSALLVIEFLRRAYRYYRIGQVKRKVDYGMG